MLRNYYYLTKPGIIYGNLIAAIAGFLFASTWDINLFLFFSMILGLSLIIASGCVFNNVIDRKIDAKMNRTKNRALVTGKITVPSAIIFGFILCFIGIVVLYKFTNFLTVLTALVGLFFYAVVYTFSKRGTVYSTLIGSISGAVPPVVGYVAVSNEINIQATLLFLILVVWQMPHFYSIAIFRFQDYKAAKIPVLPVKEGIKKSKEHIVFYIVLFILLTSSIFIFGYKGYLYIIPIMTVTIYWLAKGVEGFEIKDDNTWAKKMFRLSLIVLLVFCLTISI